MQKLVVGLAMDAKRDSKTVDKINRRLIAYFLFFFFLIVLRTRVSP